MKKIWVGIGAVVAVVAAYFLLGTGPDENLQPAAGNPAPVTASTTTTAYKDGTYTGSTETSVYGPVQVAVTISGGVITDVEVPVYPDAPGHTSQVSAAAVPALKQEALAAQSTKVDIVSGATQTSEAFNQSLASALAQAS